MGRLDMIHQDIFIRDYGWKVSVWYAVRGYRIAGVLTDLRLAGCPPEEMLEFRRFMDRCEYDKGMTYSNTDTRESVMVIGLAGCAEQYANTIAHEAGHLAENIASECGVDLRSEEFCYLIGKIAEKMYPVSHRLTCPECMNGKKLS